MNRVSQPSPPRPALRPGLAAAAFLILVLGFAAAGAVLIAGKAVRVNELPYPDPSRLVILEGRHTEKGEVQQWAISQMDFADWQKENRSFEQMSVFTSEYALNLGGPHAERLNAELVSHNYFPLLGATPEVGRFFLPEEDRVPFQHAVVVLSHDLWQRCCGGDKAIVGRTLDLNGRPYTVVGVARKGFRGVSDQGDLWVPSMMPPGPDALEIRRWRWVSGVAVLKPGVTLEQAQEDMNRVTAGLEKRYPDMNQGMGVQLTSLQETAFGAVLQDLPRIAWAAALLLLFACATAAILLRGASSRQAVTLALPAAVLGLALATWALHAVAPVSGLDLPSFTRLSPDAAAVGAILGLALVCGLIVGLASRAARGGAGWRIFQGAVVAVQAVAAVALLITAFRLAGHYRELVGQDLAFRPDNLLTLRIDPRGPKYKEDPPVIAIVRQYLDRLSRLDGVETVAMGGPAIPSDNWAGGYMTVEERDNPDTPDGTWMVMMHAVSPDYFKALGVPMVQGRAFSGNEEHTFSAVVSKALAERSWPGQNPIGKRFKFGVRSNTIRPWLTVRGVVPDIRQDGYQGIKRPAPDVYIPLLEFQVRLPLTLNFLVRARDGVAAESLAPAVEREIRAVAPDVPPYDVATMQERLDGQVRKDRLAVLVSAFFALAAVALTAAAVWGAAARRPDRAAVATAGESPGMPAAASR